MHASVQHKPFTSHSMSIKVATAVCVFTTLREPKNRYSVIRNGASRFEAFLLHALAFLDSYKSHHHRREQLHSNGVLFFKPALAQPCGKYIYRRPISFVATIKINQSRSGHSNRAWLVYKLECLCVSVCVFVCLCVVVNSESRNTFGKGSQCATITMSNQSNAVKITSEQRQETKEDM